MSINNVSHKKERRGRPATGQSKRVGFRLDNGTIEQIEALALKNGKSVSEIIRELIKFGLENN